MVMLVAGQAHLQHRRDHLGADVDRAVDRRDGEIAALGAGPVGEVAALIGAAGVGGQLDIVDLEARLVVARLEADVVEHEEFGLGSDIDGVADRSEEHTSELQSLMRISYAVLCLKTKKKHEE